MLTLKVISALLCYPQADLQAARDEMVTAVTQEALLSPTDEAAVLDLIQQIAGADLMDLQEQYVALFDRGRSLSLHLFEHIHGESRDRGQAMVNLMQVYRAHGFTISAHELPDYLPLLLEYLSQRPREEAHELLTDAMPVISLLGARLQKAGSPYHVLFKALESFAGAPAELAAIHANVAAEGPDQTLIRMDEIWEEEAVRFLGAPSVCEAGSRPAATPVPWRSRSVTHRAATKLPPASTGDR
ncbi:MAG: nitrate reductase molybdenum cofactor assembly chaperone [Candidatus Competibacteraceae bacterium]